MTPLILRSQTMNSPKKLYAPGKCIWNQRKLLKIPIKCLKFKEFIQSLFYLRVYLELYHNELGFCI